MASDAGSSSVQILNVGVCRRRFFQRSSSQGFLVAWLGDSINPREDWEGTWRLGNDLVAEVSLIGSSSFNVIDMSVTELRCALHIC